MSVSTVFRSVVLAQVLIGSLATATALAQEEAPRFVPDAESVRRLANDALYLSADEREGRGAGTRGLEESAQYLAEQFRATGLKTDLIDGGPFQSFQLGRRRGIGPASRIVFTNNGVTKAVVEPKLRVDWTPLSIAASGPVAGPLVFAGYGITAPEFQYDDYAGIDVSGAVVVILRREPAGRTDAENWFPVGKSTRHAQFTSKIANAIAHGAKAVCFVSTANDVATTAPADEMVGERLLKFEVGAPPATGSLPVLQVSRAVVNEVLASSGTTLVELEERIASTSRPASQRLGEWFADGEVSIVTAGRKLRNVLGLLPGKGPNAAETIVVGAHYDHLGNGGYGSLSSAGGKAIHNGADDNASGTAVVLEVARLLSESGNPLDRSVLFIGFSAEELGLIGSSHYVKKPLVPMDRTVAMLNLDMVGRLRGDKVTIYGTGTAEEFPQLLAEEVPRFGMRFTSHGSGYGPSDHASFAEENVPVLHFFTGFHPEYHRPEDDFATLNVDGMARLASLTAALVERIANAEKRPTPQESNGFAELLGDSSGGITRATPGRVIRTSNPVYLGVVRELEHEGEGYAIRSVFQNSPAERAGLRRGDVLVQCGGQKILEPKELQEILKARKPGDRDSLTVRRGTLEFSCEVVWEAPPAT
ncbi:MAG: M28 family peptidase [Planctomycetaceae bacterium]|nr:M28 family peptidase [Planctomycetaceae bacterium]